MKQKEIQAFWDWVEALHRAPSCPEIPEI